MNRSGLLLVLVLSHIATATPLPIAEVRITSHEKIGQDFELVRESLAHLTAELHVDERTGLAIELHDTIALRKHLLKI